MGLIWGLHPKHINLLYCPKILTEMKLIILFVSITTVIAFPSGSILENLRLRTAEDCQAYLKPGVKLEELDEELNRGCGCNPGPPVKCTGMDIKKVDGTLSCQASEDCQNAIQKMDDIWKEYIFNPICLLTREVYKLMNDICIH